MINTNQRKAFTLIELLIVIAIIGILFIVLVSKVDFATDKAKETGVQTDFRSFQMAFETVARENAGFSELVDTDYDVLEMAINRNLDNKLKINIDADGNITMVNNANDPWKNVYHGVYLSNNNGLDRGAVVIYSDGANLIFGTSVNIINGYFEFDNASESGNDDYAIATMYSLANGNGQTISVTKGFSSNQTVGNVDVQNGPANTPGNGTNDDTTNDDVVIDVPDENPTAVLNDYTWDEIKALAQANLSPSEYESKYGIKLGQKKDNTYVLVDFGYDDDGDGKDNNYGGFVFMYNSKKQIAMNTNNKNNGGYGAYAMDVVDSFFDALPEEIQNVITPVNITYIAGYDDYAEQAFYTTTTPVRIFLPSYKEVGLTDKLSGTYAKGYNAEGEKFDYFIEGTSNSACTLRRFIGPQYTASSYYWLRSTDPYDTRTYCFIWTDGTDADYAGGTRSTVSAFVVG